MNEKYTTPNGSTAEISGEYGGKASIDFDWFEEPDACGDCQVESYPEDGYLVWHCNRCGGGKAKLTKVDREKKD